jgi:hypothetical protein
MHWLSYYAPPVLLTAALIFGIDIVTGGYWKLSTPAGQRWRPALVTATVVVVVALGLLDLARGTIARPFIYGQF